MCLASPTSSWCPTSHVGTRLNGTKLAQMATPVNQSDGCDESELAPMVVVFGGTSAFWQG